MLCQLYYVIKEVTHACLCSHAPDAGQMCNEYLLTDSILCVSEYEESQLPGQESNNKGCPMVKSAMTESLRLHFTVVDNVFFQNLVTSFKALWI